MTVSFTDDGKFIPPHSAPLQGQQSFFHTLRKFLNNPLESFSTVSYENEITSETVLGMRIHVITGPEGFQEVLHKQATKFCKSPLAIRVLRPVTKEGLVIVEDQQWRRQRRGVAPIFRQRHMADLTPLLSQVMTEFSDDLAKAAGEVELTDIMHDLTFDMLAKCLLGDPKGLGREKLKAAMGNMIKAVGTMRIDDIFPWPGWMPRPFGLKGYFALRRLRKTADKLLESRDGAPPSDDLVGLLLSATDPKSGAKLTRREQRDNLIGFFAAGHETTALALTWALYLVGMDKQVQTKILAEVRSVRPSGPLVYEDFDNLPYTRAVIFETMRLFPSVPIIPRIAREDTEVLGRAVKKDDVITLGVYIMHRTERLWDNPNVFDPERFIREPELARGKGKFMPYGAGPRICVGAAFANMESLLVLATLVRDFEINIPPGTFPKPHMTITLRPKNGIKAVLTKREKTA